MPLARHGSKVGTTRSDGGLVGAFVTGLAMQPNIWRMPTVFRNKAFRFYFYSNEGDPREPTHVHVRGNGGEAKLWLRPEVRVATSNGLNASILRELVEAAERNVEMIERTWNDHFG